MSLSTAGDGADCDNDDSVDARDLLMFCEGWLSGQLPSGADIDRNGIVNFPDYAALADNWPARIEWLLIAR
jgi:hypothetical protein